MGKVSRIISENLTKLRKDSGLTMEELSDKSGVSRTTLHQIIKETTSPGADTIEALANSLGVEPWALLLDKNSADKFKNPNLSHDEILEILSALQKVSLSRRLFVLSFLFGDESLFPEEYGQILPQDVLEQLYQDVPGENLE